MSDRLVVIIPAHDAARWIAEAITSVHAQGIKPPPDVVVVTDRCSDDTACIARSLGARIIDSASSGPASARNAGVVASTARLIAFLDADDVWPPGSLAPRLALLEANPGAALVFGDCLQFDDHSEGRRPHSRTLFEEGQLDAIFFGHPSNVRDAMVKLLEADFVTTGSVIMRRTAFEELGGFDVALGLVEDLDLWLRAAGRYPILWHPALALLRRRHGSNLSRDATGMQQAYLDVLARLAIRPEGQPLQAHITRLRRRGLRELAGRYLRAGHLRKAWTRLWRSITA
jgi:glycosyltransferase involved in cell wall biosynthesis